MGYGGDTMEIDRLIEKTEDEKLLRRIRNLLLKKVLTKSNACFVLSVLLSCSIGNMTIELFKMASSAKIVDEVSSDEIEKQLTMLELMEEVPVVSTDEVQTEAIEDTSAATVSQEEVQEPKEPDNEEKKEAVLSEYNLTSEQFDVLASCVLAESKAECYQDAYAVINTMYNRTISNNWINYVNNIMEGQNGSSIYYQCICPGQFVVYQSKAYLEFLNQDRTALPGYQAIIDFLYTKNSMHDFLSFRSSSAKAPGRTQFVKGGNWYFNNLTSADRVETAPKESSVKVFAKK